MANTAKLTPDSSGALANKKEQGNKGHTWPDTLGASLAPVLLSEPQYCYHRAFKPDRHFPSGHESCSWLSPMPPAPATLPIPQGLLQLLRQRADLICQSKWSGMLLFGTWPKYCLFLLYMNRALWHQSFILASAFLDKSLFIWWVITRVIVILLDSSFISWLVS